MPNFQTSSPRSLPPMAHSPAIRVEFDSAFVALSVTPSRIGLGEVQIVKAKVNGRRQVVAFFHFDGSPMTMAQELACEMANVVVCCCPNRLPAEFQAKHLLSGFIPADPGALCLTYEGREVVRGENGSVIAEYFLGDEGFNEGCEASFGLRVRYEAAFGMTQMTHLDEGTPNPVGPTFHDHVPGTPMSVLVNGSLVQVEWIPGSEEYATDLQGVAVGDGVLVLFERSLGDKFSVFTATELALGESFWAACNSNSYRAALVNGQVKLLQPSGEEVPADHMVTLDESVGVRMAWSGNCWEYGRLAAGASQGMYVPVTEHLSDGIRFHASDAILQEDHAPLGEESCQPILMLERVGSQAFTVGIEVEGFFPEAKAAPSFWKACEDASIESPDRFVSKELVSKVLEESEVAEAIGNFSAWAQEVGFESRPGNKCGVHVHVAPQGRKWSSGELDALRKVAYVCGPLFMSEMEPASGRVGYCGTEGNPLEMLEQGTRYRWLNVDNACRKHGTVEFRLFDGTTDKNKLLAMVNFACSVASYVSTYGAKAAMRLMGAIASFGLDSNGGEA